MGRLADSELDALNRVFVLRNEAVFCETRLEVAMKKWQTKLDEGRGE